MGALLTPNELFYIRNHLPVPQIDPETYRLKVEGEGLRTVRRWGVRHRAACALFVSD